MAGSRERLIAGGWKQGVVLEPGSLRQADVTETGDAIGFLVLTQTCDCINPDFGKEPHLELLPLVLRDTRKGNPDPNYENGRNPREIHFRITIKGETECIVSRIKDIQLVDRKQIERFRFSEEIVISQEVIDDIIEWRAARYYRAAFPDRFEEAFKPLQKQLAGLFQAGEVDQLVDSILLRLEPLDEIEAGGCYELDLRLMVTPIIAAQPAKLARVQKLASDIQAMLTTSESFFEPKCVVEELDKMTLWTARNFLDFSRYDHLSFGQTDSAPNRPDTSS